MAKKNMAKITLPRAVASLAYLTSPDTGHKFSDNKYKVTMRYSEDPFAGLIEKAKEIAANEWGGEVDFEEVRLPFKTAEEQTKEYYEGCWTITPKTKFAPSLFDSRRKPLPRGVKIQGGDEIAAIIVLLPYEKSEKVKEGKRLVDVMTYGITAQLKAVQLIRKNAGEDGSDFDEYEDGFDSDDYSPMTDDAAADTPDEDDSADY